MELDERHLAAGIAELLRDGKPDGPRAAGDECDLTVQGLRLIVSKAHSACSCAHQQEAAAAVVEAPSTARLANRPPPMRAAKSKNAILLHVCGRRKQRIVLCLHEKAC